MYVKGIIWSPSKVINRLGKEINNPESIYYWAYKVLSIYFTIFYRTKLIIILLIQRIIFQYIVQLLQMVHWAI
jgi:hypothetical protein